MKQQELVFNKNCYCLNSRSTSATIVSYTTQVLTVNALEGGSYSVKIKDSGLCTDNAGNIIELNLRFFN